jgi:POT family proton-dependent oligopeptide transporter
MPTMSDEKETDNPHAEPGVEAEPPKTSPAREIFQPFIDLIHAERALQGINIPYFLEGVAYWGILGYLAMYFNQYVSLDDVWAGRMVGVLTWGITISMFFFGTLADRWGVRIALILAFILMLGGRVALSAAPYLGLQGGSIWTPLNGIATGGILLVVVGYGMYQPAAYAAVRQFTTEKTAGMGYAMLYALMNLGGWIPTWFTPIRKSAGIRGVFWMLTGLTVGSLVLTALILTRGTVEAVTRLREQERKKAKEQKDSAEGEGADGEKDEAPAPRGTGVLGWLANHPLANVKFSFFIFCLIPVQTLFAHNWLTLPMYVERAFAQSWPWISINFEKAVNFNPLLIFVMVPIVTVLTEKRKVYNMMIIGTLVMAAPTFLLALGPQWWTLVPYLFIMTLGEAMWQPRFLQYAAEIAPEGRTGAYMGVAQFPWFLTKLIVPLYSGWFLQRYCPKEGPMDTGTMWLIYGVIAVSSTVMLVLAKGWVGKDFKTKAD